MSEKSKSWFEILITPLTLVIITTGAGLYIEGLKGRVATDIRKLRNEHEEKIAKLNLQTKSLEIFFQYIGKEGAKETQLLGLQALNNLPPEVSKNLAEFIKSKYPNDTEVARAADKIIENAAERQAPIVQAKLIRSQMNFRTNDSKKVICSLDKGQTVEIIEQYPVTTTIRASCPNDPNKIEKIGFVYNYQGERPYKLIDEAD